jgi:hypothetical protein
MPRPRKAQPETAETGAQAVVFQEDIPADTLVAPLAPTEAPEPVAAFYSVGVRNRCPWATVRSASTDWGRTPTIIRADDARLNELQRCEWLLVAPVP